MRRYLKHLTKIFGILLCLALVAVEFMPVTVTASKSIISLALSMNDTPCIYKGETVTQETSNIGNVLISYKGVTLKFDGYADQYTRIYCFGKYDRIVEISNFPRAYKDTAQHIYTVNTSFTVAEGDLNYYDANGRWYMDSKGVLVGLGKRATHYIGESLPGSFPMWLEYGTLQSVSDTGKLYFTTNWLPPESKVITAILINSDNASLIDVTDTSYLQKQVTTKNFTMGDASKGAIARQILYIHYQYNLGY